MSKNKSPLNEWIEKETINNVSYKEQFLKNHLLPLECNFEITEFDHFFTERKKILFDELYKILK